MMDDSDDDSSVLPPLPDAAPATPARRSSYEDSSPESAQRRSPMVPPTPQAAVPATPVMPPSTPHDDDDDPSSPPLTPLSELGEEHQPPAQEGEDVEMQEEEPLDDTLVVRGTNVHVPTAAATFTAFLREFRSLQHSTREQQRQEDDDDSSDDDDDSEDELPPLYYRTKLEQLAEHGVIVAGEDGSTTTSTSLDIDSMHLYYHNPACQLFYHQLVSYPMEMVPLMDLVVRRELESLGAQDLHIQVRPYRLKELANMRCLDPTRLDTLLSIRGMMVRASAIIPDLKVAHFQCTICGASVRVPVDRGRIAEPTRCETCTCRNSFQLIHNQSVFADKQAVRLQETPDEVPAGQTPASVVSFCFDDLVDSVKPGDRVEVTGVLRAQPRRVNPRVTKVGTVYKTYVDVVHFRKIASGSREENESRTGMQTRFTPKRIEQLKQLSEAPDIYAQLTQSLAPSIWELDDVKKGILCMLFGGNHVRVKQRRDGAVVSEDEDDSDSNDDEGEDITTGLDKRGDINILLCGDPGTSKSQLLSHVHKIASRGVYTSGKGSSAVGLTASVVRDPETRDLVLESGALVLSDLGVCCIDEFDKMSDSTRSVLHEAMEQQTVSIAKAGIIATLHARTSILASANPTESRYNPSRSVVENIKLPPTLLSRFDLIYLVLDSPNVDHDRRLAQHLVGLYYETPNVVKPPLDQELMRDYIEYARTHVHPSLGGDATKFLLKSYLQMRSMGGTGTRTISATPRQLESLIRLSEALAKMRFASEVERRDAEEAVRLMRVATQAAATDPRTGRIDMDMITTGRSMADRQAEESLDLTIKELLTERRGNRMAVRDVTRQLTEITNTSVSQDEVVEALRRLESDGLIQFNERAQTVFVRSGVVG